MSYSVIAAKKAAAAEHSRKFQNLRRAAEIATASRKTAAA